ncbi:MAG: ATP phosphoribosyltransferase regulatory subunit [Alphaproteobacteria bacterium]|nr:ATP phosphoribosyltransferase regulatory subunit [Alphaproteobacteria bacterium]
MADFAKRALLPAGLRDILPPGAAFEAHVIETLTAFFAANGYERVKPPLIEFEEGLLSGSGAAMSGQTFRVMDPLSHRMMGVRADMTLQVARIATTRLVNTPRPLRLAYAGQVLRVKGAQLRPARQFAQAGIELIGASTPTADAEVVLLAAEALIALGIGGVSVDLNVPTLVRAIFDEMEVDTAQRGILRDALNRKDAATVAAAGGRVGALLTGLLAAGGTCAPAMAALGKLDLPPAAALARDTLAEVIERVRTGAPDLTLTVDPVEHRGFEYHAGVGFAIFARGAAGELGRGGRYLAGEGLGVPATGATLFVDALIEILSPPSPTLRILLPVGTARSVARDLQCQQWVTVGALEPVADLVAEARRMGCSHAYLDNRPVAVDVNS